MPKLRSLTGTQVIAIFAEFGFTIKSAKGSHTKLTRRVGEQEQLIVVALHGGKSIPIGTLHSIYKQGCRFIPEAILKPHFYTD